MRVMVDHLLLKRMLHHLNYWKNGGGYNAVADRMRIEIEEELVTRGTSKAPPPEPGHKEEACQSA